MPVEEVRRVKQLDRAASDDEVDQLFFCQDVIETLLVRGQAFRIIRVHFY